MLLASLPAAEEAILQQQEEEQAAMEEALDAAMEEALDAMEAGDNSLMETLVERLQAEEEEADGMAASPAEAATVKQSVIGRRKARELGAFPLLVHTTDLRINACMVEEEVQKILFQHFDFGVQLNRAVAMGWKIEDKFKASIVFLTCFPHTAPMETEKVSKTTGNKLPSHIFCGPDKTKLLVNW